MATMKNYRDISPSASDMSAGFQFEFYCMHCDQGSWRSPFKPYRMGQVTGWLSRFAFLFSGARTVARGTGNFADAGSRGAKDEALQEAMVTAAQRYTRCESCRDYVCGECWSDRDEKCLVCIGKSNQAAQSAARQQAEEAKEASAHSCPNCRTAMDGGRFCPECGFDMASTHKACPSCGAMTSRQSRFCTDCGHGF